MNIETQKMNRPLPKSAVLAVLMVFFLSMAAYIGKYNEKKAHLRDEAAFGELAAALSQVVRAESPEPGRLSKAKALMAGAEAVPPKGSATGHLFMGAGAYLAENLKEADDSFAAAGALMPDSPDLYSFQASASLRLGNTARAEELYIKALAMKSGAGYDPMLLTPDQLGLALCLFLLHRADEALPLAEQAWDLRRRQLGPSASDTISAASRLATIYVALAKPEEAEALLRQAYLEGLAEPEANRLVLEEARLFLMTIAKSSERAAEMEEFFARAQGSPADNAEAAPKEAPEPKVTAETLAAWEELALKMRGYDDALAADLLVRLIIGRQDLAGLDLYHPDLKPLHLELARAYMDSAQFNAAEEELRPLLNGAADRASEEFLNLSALMAQIQEGAGRFRDAEAEYLAMAEVLDAQVAAAAKTKAGADPLLVGRMLELHLQIAENLLKQGRAAAEAELELRAALGRLNPRRISGYPGAAEIYLRLARLLKGAEKRARDRADYYRRAKRAAETVLKGSPGPETEAWMKGVIAAVADETRSGRGTRKPPPKEGAAPRELPPLPDAEMLRHELSALAALDRLSEFQARIESVLAEAAGRFGDDSPAYLRYYSLKLKGLEEEGRIDDLTGELVAQAARPKGRSPEEQALTRAGALAYAARVNGEAGREDRAAQFYQEALATLEGQEGEAAQSRRSEMEGLLQQLSRKGP